MAHRSIPLPTLAIPRRNARAELPGLMATGSEASEFNFEWSAKPLERRGASIVTFNPDQPSYQEVRKVLSGNPDWIVCACGQQSGVTILRQADAAGFDGDLMVTADIITPEAIKAVGPQTMESVCGELASSDSSLAAYKAFAEAFKAKYKADPYPFTANAYDAAVLTELTMAAAKATDGEAINDKLSDVANPGGTDVHSLAQGLAALARGEDINYDGASGPVDLDDSGTASSPYSIQQVTNGRWKQVAFYGADVFAAP